MSIALNTALENINPNETRFERLKRDEQRQAQLNQQIMVDDQMRQRNDQLLNEQYKLANEEMSKLDPLDQERVREQARKAREQLFNEFQKHGDVNRFMRAGGMRMVNEYVDNILGSDTMQKGRFNSMQAERLKQFQQAKIPVSKRSIAQYNAYRKGLRDNFEIVPLEKIDLSEIKKSYFNHEIIDPAAILREYRPQLIANYMIEYDTDITPDQKDLDKYVNDNFGNVYGERPDYRAQQSGARTSGGRSGANSSSSNKTVRRFGTMMTTSLFNINKYDSSEYKLQYGDDGSLKRALEREELIPLKMVSSQALNTANSENMQPQEAYEIRGLNGTQMLKAMQLSPGNSEQGGTFAISTGDTRLYNAKGAQRTPNGETSDYSGEEKDLTLKAKRVVFSKSMASMMTANGDRELLMFSKDPSLRKEQEDRFAQATDGSQAPDIRAGIFVEAVDENGETYYVEYEGGAVEVSALNQTLGEYNVLTDEMNETQQLQASTQRAAYQQYMQNAANTRDYHLSLGFVEDLANSKQIDIDVNFIAPLANSFADIALSVNPELTREQAIRIGMNNLEIAAKEDDELHTILYGGVDNPTQALRNWMNGAEPEQGLNEYLIESYNYYANIDDSKKKSEVSSLNKENNVEENKNPSTEMEENNEPKKNISGHEIKNEKLTTVTKEEVKKEIESIPVAKTKAEIKTVKKDKEGKIDISGMPRLPEKPLGPDNTQDLSGMPKLPEKPLGPDNTQDLSGMPELNKKAAGPMPKRKFNLNIKKVKNNNLAVKDSTGEKLQTEKDFVILHQTGVSYSDELIKGNKIIDADGNVHYTGAQYYIDKDGTIYQSADEKDVVYHAGKSKIGDEGKVNERSFGIEIISDSLKGGNDKKGYYEPLTEPQINAVANLLAKWASEKHLTADEIFNRVFSHHEITTYNSDWRKLPKESLDRYQNPQKLIQKRGNFGSRFHGTARKVDVDNFTKNQIMSKLQSLLES